MLPRPRAETHAMHVRSCQTTDRRIVDDVIMIERKCFGVYLHEDSIARGCTEQMLSNFLKVLFPWNWRHSF